MISSPSIMTLMEDKLLIRFVNAPLSSASNQLLLVSDSTCKLLLPRRGGRSFRLDCHLDCLPRTAVSSFVKYAEIFAFF